MIYRKLRRNFFSGVANFQRAPPPQGTRAVTLERKKRHLHAVGKVGIRLARGTTKTPDKTGTCAGMKMPCGYDTTICPLRAKGKRAIASSLCAVARECKKAVRAEKRHAPHAALLARLSLLPRAELRKDGFIITRKCARVKAERA